jgi:hypothetical protein
MYIKYKEIYFIKIFKMSEIKCKEVINFKMIDFIKKDENWPKLEKRIQIYLKENNFKVISAESIKYYKDNYLIGLRLFVSSIE